MPEITTSIACMLAGISAGIIAMYGSGVTKWFTPAPTMNTVSTHRRTTFARAMRAP